MKIFLDTANIEDIRKYNDMGLLDGITTNPTLLAKEGGDPHAAMKETTDIIKGVSVRYLAGGAKSTERDVTYSIKPRAIKDYTGDVVTNLAEDIDATQKTFTVDDTTNIKDEFYIVIDNEEMLVKSISASTSKITVQRGKDSTLATSHVRGTDIKGIDYTDNSDGDGVDSAIIPMGDDFGFSGTIT